MISRRTFMGTASVFAAASGGPVNANPTWQASGKARDSFLWGAGTSPYQVEGNSLNSDGWLLENVQPSLFQERSGDACDSYNRFRDDIAIVAALGLNCYRFGIEWARIEPDEGHFSIAELDHYASMLDACRESGLKPVVTFSHLSFPRWFAERGGFEADGAAELFERFCSRAASRLADRMYLATTFNEPNLPLVLRAIPAFPNIKIVADQSLAAAARKSGSRQFSSLVYAEPGKTMSRLRDAHIRGYQAIKAARPDLPVGFTMSTQDVQSVGAASDAKDYMKLIYGEWPDIARAHSDYIGVQTYTRVRVGPNGLLPPPPGSELTETGDEFYPKALEATIRWAHSEIKKPIYVTENGVAVQDDARRVAFIAESLDGVRACLRDGIDLRGYIHWSLLDSFEWNRGYSCHFGLCAVDRLTFRRTPKPSALAFGARARTFQI